MTTIDIMYRVLPCMNGVALVPSASVADRIAKAGFAGPAFGAPLLPGGLDEDQLLEWEIYLPAIVSLTVDDLDCLDASSPEHFAFTHFGPPEQDKDSNQDFALAGRLPGANGIADARFAIIADGISNGYALAQRGAILTCFAAFSAVKDTWSEMTRAGKPVTSEEVAVFRDGLAARIRSYFEADRTHILNSLIRPPCGIPEEVWHGHFRNHPTRWYGNTLALAFMSPLGGIIAFIGDGGIILIRGDASNPVEIQRSPDENVLDNFVSWDIEGSNIKAAAVKFTLDAGYFEVILATDGVDRTFQLNERSLTDLFTSDVALQQTRNLLMDFEGTFPKRIDIDNLSIARLLFYTGKPPADRLASASPALDRGSPVTLLGPASLLSEEDAGVAPKKRHLAEEDAQSGTAHHRRFTDKLDESEQAPDDDETGDRLARVRSDPKEDRPYCETGSGGLGAAQPKKSNLGSLLALIGLPIALFAALAATVYLTTLQYRPDTDPTGAPTEVQSSHDIAPPQNVRAAEEPPAFQTPPAPAPFSDPLETLPQLEDLPTLPESIAPPASVEPPDVLQPRSPETVTPELAAPDPAAQEPALPPAPPSLRYLPPSYWSNRAPTGRLLPPHQERP